MNRARISRIRLLAVITTLSISQLQGAGATSEANSQESVGEHWKIVRVEEKMLREFCSALPKNSYGYHLLRDEGYGLTAHAMDALRLLEITNSPFMYKQIKYDKKLPVTKECKAENWKDKLNVTGKFGSFTVVETDQEELPNSNTCITCDCFLKQTIYSIMNRESESFLPIPDWWCDYECLN